MNNNIGEGRQNGMLQESSGHSELSYDDEETGRGTTTNHKRSISQKFKSTNKTTLWNAI
jgi:hypothetical protein